MTSWAATTASIPSPSSPTLSLGPVDLRFYGLLIAVGVVLATRVTMARWARRGGDPTDILDIIVVVVICGVLGARVYHVITDYQRFEGRWIDALKLWKGGLSIWGAVMGGAIGVIWSTRRRGLDTLAVMDAMAPSLFVAQAIGRWGNWFNQELFGKPTDLPWALEIDPEHRPLQYLASPTFHPIFLYESLYCALGLVLVLALERRRPLARGQVFAAYIAYYCFGRFFLELLRVDAANTLLGLRVNAWVSALLCAFGVGWYVVRGRRSPAGDPEAVIA